MLTIEWQRADAAPRLRASRTPSTKPGMTDAFDEAMDALGRAATTRSRRDFPSRRRTRCRWPTGCGTSMQFNAREAMHLLELRSSPQGHPAYRRVALEMHRLIAEQAGHRAIAAAMRHVDHDDARARTPRRRTRRRERVARPARCDRSRVLDARQTKLLRRRDLRPTRVDRRSGTRVRGAALDTDAARAAVLLRSSVAPGPIGKRSEGSWRSRGVGAPGDQVENAGITRLLGRPG